MVSLGDQFPAEQRRAHIDSALVPGCVVRLDVRFPEVTKPKFLVLVSDDDQDFVWFIVNSEIHPFVASRPDLAKCQVTINADESHPFLQHQSFIACDKVLKLRRDDVVRELMKNMACIQGEISDDVRNEVVAAVKFAVTLSNVEKSKILTSLNC